MAVGLVGRGPAAAAVDAALGDVDVESVAVEPGDVGDQDLVVTVAQAGDETVETVDERARAAGIPWIAVELGGVGGYPVVDAAIAGFAPEGPCYACLQGRVASNVDPAAEPVAAPPAHTARFAGAIAGRAAAVHVSGGESGIFGTAREIPHAERLLLPLPGCPCTADTSGPIPRTAPERDLEDALASAEHGLDDRVGIVQEVGEAESVPVPYYLARVCDTSGFSDASASRQAAGVAGGWDAAFMKALGEAYERYGAGVYRREGLPEGTAQEIANAVPPRTFVCRDEPAGDETLRWVEGETLGTGETVRLPAPFVHYPPGTERFRPAITTGLGLGNGGVEALLSGLYEVIERDAAMLSWYSSFEPIALRVADEGYRDLARRARGVDLSVSALLLTQDVDVPVIAAVVHREDWPRFAIGSSANLDAGAAARGALAEALQNWMELRGMGPDEAENAAGAIGHFAANPTDADRYLSVETVASAETVGPGEAFDPDAELGEVLDRLADADLTAHAARLTTTDVAAMGFEAVRVLVTAAQPLFFGDAYFGERAETVPVELGFEPTLDRRHHPFP